MQSHYLQAIIKWHLIIASAMIVFCSTQATAQLELTENAYGNYKGYLYDFWEGSGEATMTLDAPGFVSEWEADSDLFVALMGFDNPTVGSLAYAGYFDITEQGTSLLIAYGLSNTTNSQFFVIETAFDKSTISDGKFLATYESDGSLYDLYKNQSPMDPSNLDSPVTNNYYSIRRSPKNTGEVEGNIDLNAHYDAWARVGAQVDDKMRIVLGAYSLQGQGRVELNILEGSSACSGARSPLQTSSCDLSLSVNAEALVEDENSPSNTFKGDYYTLWKDNPDDNAVLILHGGGRYESHWTASTQEFIGGVGWKPGTPRTIEYSGYFTPSPNANAHLSLHGWAYDPMVEYYIVESYGSWDPSDGSSHQGSYESGGDTYDLYYRANPLFGINPIQTYEYMSVRREPKAHGSIAGKIDVQDHFNHWEMLGLDMSFSEYDYMVMATWSYRASGSSDITVKELIEEDESGSEETGSGAGSNNIWLMVIIGLLLTVVRKKYVNAEIRFYKQNR